MLTSVVVVVVVLELMVMDDDENGERGVALVGVVVPLVESLLLLPLPLFSTLLSLLKLPLLARPAPSRVGDVVFVAEEGEVFQLLLPLLLPPLLLRLL